MKKRILMLMLTIVMAVGMVGCTPKASREKEVVEEKEDDEEDKDREKTDKEKEDKEENEKSQSEKPTLGVDKAGYDGYEYLVAYEMESDDNQAIVYLPEDKYVSESFANVIAEDLGVSVGITLDPYIQSDMEDYTAEENLQEYMDMQYEFDEYYADDLKDMEVSKIYSNTDEDALVSYSYLEYDEYDEKYLPYFAMYYLVEKEDGRIFLTEIEIDVDYTESDTEDLLAELEEYLEIEIPYDKEELLAKAEAYDDSEDDSLDGNVYSTGFWKFELPKGWEQDEEASSYDEYVYAQDGTVASGSAVFIAEKYVGEDTSVVQELDEDDLLDIISSTFGDEFEVKDMRVVGDTAVGYAVKLLIRQDDVDAIAYIVFEDYNMYIIMGLEADGGEEAFDVAEDILNSAKTR